MNLVRSIRRLFNRQDESAPEPVGPDPLANLPLEDADFAPIWRQCSPYTMTSVERGLALYRAVRHLVKNEIAGDILECGVWRGGSSMIAMATLLQLNAANRRVVLLDTFEGMTAPGDYDVDLLGTSAEEFLALEAEKPGGGIENPTLEDIRRNVATIGYPADLIEYVVGDIRETAYTAPARDIALLRLDTDFYDSTKVEIEVFYPRLVEDGVLIVDDYGHWQGSRRAVDEYFDDMRRQGKRAPLLTIIDYTGRLAVK